MSVTIERLTGPALQAAIPAVSRLRISVFRDWPYLYDGDAAYEAEYLADFVQADSAVVIVARDGEEIVGAATASALTAHTPEFADLFAAHGYDPAAVFYCGESVLLPTYRGQGIGHAFFDAREAAARDSQVGYTLATFCGVIRSDDDPRRPPDYRPLDPFWRKRGYVPVPELVGSYDWPEVGSTNEIAHPMQFWVREL
jgi:GNAT superfamily N-acetyltransferase